MSNTASLRAEVLVQLAKLRSLARSIVESSNPFAAHVLLDDGRLRKMLAEETDRGVLTQTLAAFDGWTTQLADEEKSLGKLTRAGLGESVVTLFARVAAMEGKQRAKIGARQERVSARCEAVHALVAESQLPTATAADWRAIHALMETKHTELLLKRKPPRGASIDAMPPSHAAAYYISPRALRREYAKWLAGRAGN